jgi:hypothetical protein
MMKSSLRERHYSTVRLLFIMCLSFILFSLCSQWVMIRKFSVLKFYPCIYKNYFRLTVTWHTMRTRRIYVQAKDQRILSLNSQKLRYPSPWWNDGLSLQQNSVSAHKASWRHWCLDSRHNGVGFVNMQQSIIPKMDFFFLCEHEQRTLIWTPFFSERDAFSFIWWSIVDHLNDIGELLCVCG